ncbi:MAG: hypothetical protein JNM59_11560 [Hyphomonadaceae bacterium]|nr:hypothetical protein [Hyphomonadaceae bacterium]
MDAAGALANLLQIAQRALVDGDPALAERYAKAVSALARAERDVDEARAFGRAALEEDDEEFRAEVRRRLAAFVEADLADAPAEVLERIALEGVDP